MIREQGLKQMEEEWRMCTNRWRRTSSSSDEVAPAGVVGREEVARGAGGESFSVLPARAPCSSRSGGVVVGRRRWQEGKVRVRRWPAALLLPCLHDEDPVGSGVAGWWRVGSEMLVDGEWGVRGFQL
jgi:hypothetical protein